MSVRWRRRFLNPAAHWRPESDPDAWRCRQFNRISTHLCGAGRQNSLAGLRAAGARNILVVEVEHLIATGLAEALQDAGSIELGPVPTVDKAIKKIESEPHIDGAVADVNLGGMLVYPVADLLVARKIPLVFTSGYEDNLLRDRYSALRQLPHRPMSTRELKRGQVLHRSLQSIVGKRETRLVGPPICEGWLFAPR